MAEYTKEIKKHIATLGAPHSQGWTKELNIVSWNGGTPKYEIRDWSPDHSRCGKGVTFTEEELRDLRKALDESFAAPPKTDA